MVVFILKKASSLNQAVSPPNKITVTTCIRLSLPVSHHSAAIEPSRIGMNTSAATMKPEYSVPPRL